MPPRLASLASLVLIVLTAGTAPAFAQDRPDPFNAQLPDWIRVTAQERLRVEPHDLLERTRLGTRITPRPALEIVGEVQDARVAGVAHADGTLRDVLDVRQAYATVKPARSWLDVRVGRQKIAFGSERVVGGAEWGNTARVFDAIRVGVAHGRSRVDLIGASPVANLPDAPDHHQKGQALVGAYASLGAVVAGTTLEPFVLSKRIPMAAGERGDTGTARATTAGVRLVGRHRAVWTYEGELLVQRGHVASTPASAWAWTGQLQRQFPAHRWTPTLLVETNTASGDGGRDGEVNTFDQLYPTNHSIYGVADRVGRRNARNGRVGWWIRPRAGLTIKAEGNAFWLANAHDGLYAASGALAVPAPAGGASSTFVGTELDATADYRLSRHYDIGAQIGHLFPGTFLRRYDTVSRPTFYCVFVDLHL